ncbi:MAG: radical SAM protein [Candidatus Woesearchaeota archaeon]
MSNVLLFADCAGLDFVERNNLSFRYFIKNSAILRLSNFLRRQGHTVFQTHHFTSFSLDELIKLLDIHLSNNTKVVGISSSFLSAVKIRQTNPFGHYLGTDMIPQYNQTEIDRIVGVFKYVKEKFPHIKTVMGGSAVFISRFKSQLDVSRWGYDLVKPYVDFFVQGAGEIVLSKIVNNEELHFKNIYGFNVIDGNNFNIKDFSEVSNSPIEYIDGISKCEALSTELAHGCIFNCEFCTGRVLGKNKKEFMRTFDSFRNEILYNYETFGTKFYLFLDDIINDNTDKLDWLIRLRKETGIDLTWVAYARLDMIKTEEQAQRFLDAGCLGVYFGIESLKSDVGPYIGKITDKEKIISNLKLCRKIWGDNILIKASLIAGLPTETKEEFIENANYLLNTDEGRYLIDRISITPLHVYVMDKGEITIGRNYPFAQYKINKEVKKHYLDAQNWTSPWGTREEFFYLIRDVYSKVPQQVNLAHPFLFPMYETLGIDLRAFIKSIRDRTFTNALTSQQLISMINKKILEYKKMIFEITEEDVEKYHKKFWKKTSIITY